MWFDFVIMISIQVKTKKNIKTFQFSMYGFQYVGGKHIFYKFYICAVSIEKPQVCFCTVQLCNHVIQIDLTRFCG